MRAVPDSSVVVLRATSGSSDASQDQAERLQASCLAAWEALEGTPGSQAIKQASPELAKMYRADDNNHVVMQDANGLIFCIVSNHTSPWTAGYR